MVTDLSKRLNSANIFDDIFLTQLEREYVPGKCCVYFARYIGYDDEKKYNNSLLLLNENIAKLENKAILFTSSIPVPFDQELTASIMAELSAMDLNKLADEDITLVSEQQVNDRIKLALQKVVDLSRSKEAFVNENVLISFITKLMIWCNHYLSNIVWSGEMNPKCVFYGDIKKHEAYFLILLSMIGIDILYINSQGDEVFSLIDDRGEYSELIKNRTLSQVVDYKKRISQGEKVVTVQTVAHQATKEMEEVFYDSKAGIYKPWQFSEGITHPVLLTSTVDEIELYWTEPAKVRPGFKVEGKTVYVPSFFAQVNGVSRDRKEYFKMVSSLKNAKNTFFMDRADILDQNWSRQELYSLTFLLDNLGEVDYEELKKHPMYKFGFLKEELQRFIVDKINELLRTPEIFSNGISTDRRLMIIASALTMPDRLLQLIESFDYTGYIPKLVFYVNDRREFGEEDICVLAMINRIGFDILIFSPCNTGNVERAITRAYIVNHRLDDIEFDLKLQEPLIKAKGGFISKLFKK